jgi:two-component system, response regulator PdtaR
MEKKKILIIEDEMLHGVYLKSFIESSGYHVLDIVSNGEDAVLVALENHPDLIISDILLKGKMSGLDTVEEILREVDIPFIFLTALSDNVVIDRAAHLSPHAIVNKPYDLNTFLEVVHSVFKQE